MRRRVKAFAFPALVLISAVLFTSFEDVEGSGRPMFGSRTTTNQDCGGAHYNAGSGNCVRSCADYSVTTTYVFWIGFPGEPEYLRSYDEPMPDGACN